MILSNSIPFIKLLGKDEDYWIFKSRKSSLCVIRDDEGLYIDHNHKWTDSLDKAMVDKLTVMYEVAKSLEIRNKTSIVFIKL